MTTITIDRALLEELKANCYASIAEDGISDSRKEYRVDLYQRCIDELREKIIEPVALCTCPSGDGSLRWPCPVHPPAQAKPVPDVLSAKAAFESYVRLGHTPEWNSFEIGYDQGRYDEQMYQGPPAQVNQEVEKFTQFGNPESVSNDIEGHPV
jgi:hypothetical protein